MEQSSIRNQYQMRCYLGVNLREELCFNVMESCDAALNEGIK